MYSILLMKHLMRTSSVSHSTSKVIIIVFVELRIVYNNVMLPNTSHTIIIKLQLYTRCLIELENMKHHMILIMKP